MKFGQLIEYKQRNIFLQKSYRKWGRVTRMYGYKKIRIYEYKNIRTKIAFKMK